MCSNFPKVNTNSISGVRALAHTSRTCRALASPYFFKPLKCEFKELQTGDGQQNPPVVLLSAADNFKTLQFHVVPQPRGHQLMTITQVLSVEDTYECLEYLPDRCGSLVDQFNLSVPALDLFSRTLPMLSRLVLDLGYFIGYSTSWDQAYKKATEKFTRNYLPYIDGLDIIHAIARFQTLRCVTLRYKLVRDQIALMHPNPGCEAVREMFESLQRRKRGQSLVRFEVVFYTSSTMIFGRHYKTCTVSTTMKIVCNNDTFSSQGGEQSQCNFTCDDPRYGKAIERRKRIERLYGKLAWTKGFGTIQHKLQHGRYRSLPRRIVMESLLRLALLPSYFVFEEGKRVQFEPSLANVEV